MERILMTKYGFVRWPEQDFSDDGTRFTCYRVGNRVRVSKATHQGEVFIDARIDGVKLPFDVYSQLPHYRAISKLNGIRMRVVSEQDLVDLYNACIAYEQEYENAEATTKYPALSEVEAQCERVKAKLEGELAIAEAMFSRYAVQLTCSVTEYEWKYIREYFKSLKERAETYDVHNTALVMLGTARSIDFCKPDCYDLRETWYFTALMKLFAKYLDT